MAVLNNRYTITSTQKLPAGSTFIPASQIKSTTTVQKNTDNYRPISYSSEMKQAAQKLADSGNPVGSYYLWQDNENATGSAAWMESELKKKGIDLSSKSNTGNAVADFFIEAGKGIIEIPIGLKRTLAAGSLGAVGVSQQSTKQAVKTLSEGTSKAISSTVDSAIDNPGRFTGAVVGGIVLTKGIGKLSAVPKTAKVTTAKTTTGTTKTASLTVGKRTASISVQKSKTAAGTTKTTTAGILNTKTGKQTRARVSNTKTITAKPDIKTGNLVLSKEQGTLRVIQKGNKVIGTGKKTIVQKTAQTDSGMVLPKGQLRKATAITSKQTETKRIRGYYGKLGALKVTKERTSKTRKATEKTATHTTTQTSARLTVGTRTKTAKTTETKKKGNTVKSTTKGTDTQRTKLLVNADKVLKTNLLSGSKKKGRGIKVVNRSEILLNKNRALTGKRTSIKSGTRSAEIMRAKAQGYKVRDTRTASANTNRATIRNTFKTTEKPKTVNQARAKAEAKETNAKIKTQRKEKKAETKAEKKIKPEIVGHAIIDESGKIKRVKPEGYDKAVMKVQKQIRTGRLSNADRQFLQNRRDNKLGKSGDAEALYNRRKMMEAQRKVDNEKAKKEGKPQVKRPVIVKEKRDSRKKKAAVSGTTTGTTRTTSNTQYHDAGNGMMYATKTTSKAKTETAQTKAKAKATVGTYQTANILRGQQATKTAQKVRGTAVTTKQAAGTKTATKQSQTATTTRTQAKTNRSASTTAKTSGNSVKQRTGEKSKQDSKRAVAVVTAHRQATAQAQRTAQKKKQRSLVKLAHAAKKKQKRILRLSEEEKKKIRKPKTKKSKGYLRSEKRNALSWIDDNSKLMKEKKLKN